MQRVAVDALALDGANPDLHNGLGRLFDYRSSEMTRSKQERLQLMQNAMQHYRQVILLRPAWPYGYLNLVSVKVRIKAFDAEFRQMLLQLVKRSPWEHNTLPALVRLAVISWPYLDNPTRESLKPYLLQASEKRTGEVKRVLQLSKQLDYFCLVIAHDEDDLKLCK